MSSQDFGISVDFQKAIDEFNKFTYSNRQLTAATDKLIQTWKGFNKDLERLYQNTKTFSGGWGIINKQVMDAQKGFRELNIVLTRYLDISGQTHTSVNIAVRRDKEHLEVIKAKTAALKEQLSTAERVRLANVSAATFGPGFINPRNKYADSSFRASAEQAKEMLRVLQANQFQASFSNNPANNAAFANFFRQMQANQNLALLFNQANLPRSPQTNFAPGPGRGRGGGGFRPTPSLFNAFPNAPQPSGGGGIIAPAPMMGGLWDISPKHAIQVFATYRALALMRDGLVDANEAAHTLSRTIAEMQTITQKSNVTFEQFKDEILALSNAFGLAAEDVASATYLALSNQVVDAGKSMIFMNEAAKLANVSQATLSESVNALSSVINSYRLSAENANEISGTLFKTFDLGRIRLSEISDSIGTVTVLGAQLGVDFNEIAASLTAMTRNGVTASNAMTFLRGLLQKLIEPTEEMKNLFKEWGVASGEMAVKTFSFAGILKKLNEATGGNSESLGELVTNVRALQASIALAGKSMDIFNKDLDEFKTKSSEYDKAVNIIDESQAIQINKQLQTMRNAWINVFVDLQKGALSLTQALGGLNKVAGVVAVVLGALTIRWALFNSQVVSSTTNLAAMNAQAAKTTYTMRGLNIAMSGLASFGIGLGISAATIGLIAMQANAEEARLEMDRLIAEGLSKMATQLSKESQPAIENITNRYKSQLEALAALNAKTNEHVVAQETLAKVLHGVAGKEFDKQIERNKTLVSELKKSRTEIENLSKESAKQFAEKDRQIKRDTFERQLNETSGEEKIQLLEAEIALNKEKIRDLSKFATAFSINEQRKLSDIIISDLERVKELKGDVDINILDKSPGQLMEERRRGRKVDELNRIENNLRLEKNEERRNDLLARRSKILGEIQEIAASISAKDDARVAGLPFRPESTESKIRTAKKDALDIEKNFLSASEQEIEFLNKQIRLRDQANDALAIQKEAWEKINVATKEASAHIEAIANAVNSMSGIDFRDSFVKQLRAAGIETSSLNTLIASKAKQEADARKITLEAENAIKNIREQSKAKGDKAIESNRIASILSVIGSPISSFPVPSAIDESDPAFGFFSQLKSLRDRSRGMKLDAESRERRGIEVASAFNFSEDDISFIKTFISQKDVLRRFLDKEEVESLEGLSRSLGGTDPNAPGTLKIAEFTIEKNIQNFDTLNSELAVTIEKLKLMGITIDNIRASKSDIVIDSKVLEAMSSGSGTEELEGRSAGGYSLRGGIHHPGEYVLNKRVTNKYRSLLQKMNEDSSELYRLGQYGGRTGFANPELMTFTPYKGINNNPFTIMSEFGNRFINPRDDFRFNIPHGNFTIMPEFGNRFINPGMSYSDTISPYLNRSMSMNEMETMRRHSGWKPEGQVFTINGLTINASMANDMDVRAVADQVVQEIRRSTNRGLRVL